MGRHSSGADRAGNEWNGNDRSGGAVPPRSQSPSDRGRSSDARSGSDDDFGFEHRNTDGGRRGGWLWAGAVLLVVVALVTGVIIWQTGAGGCGDRTRVAVASDSAMTGPLREVARQASADSCFDYDVQTAAGADVPGLLTQGAAAPDLWVADSQVQARRVTTQVRRDLDLVSPSIASSPTVVAGTDVPGHMGRGHEVA